MEFSDQIKQLRKENKSVAGAVCKKIARYKTGGVQLEK